METHQKNIKGTWNEYALEMWKSTRKTNSVAIIKSFSKVETTS